MNTKLIAFARADIKKGLKQCSAEEVNLFKRMYDGGKLEASVDEVVDKLDPEKLSWAMEQVDNTLAKKK